MFPHSSSWSATTRCTRSRARRIAEAFIREMGARVRAVVTTVPDGVSGREIDLMPKLELIACFGRALAKIDLAAAKRRGIRVTDVPHSVAVPVAELALGLMIAIMRRVVEAERYVASGQVCRPEKPFPPGRGLPGKVSASSDWARSRSRAREACWRHAGCRCATTGRGRSRMLRIATTKSSRQWRRTRTAWSSRARLRRRRRSS